MSLVRFKGDCHQTCHPQQVRGRNELPAAQAVAGSNGQGKEEPAETRGTRLGAYH